MKAVVAAFNQEKALVGAFSVITNLRIELFQALVSTLPVVTIQMMPECQSVRLTARCPHLRTQACIMDPVTSAHHCNGTVNCPLVSLSFGIVQVPQFQRISDVGWIVCEVRRVNINQMR